MPESVMPESVMPESKASNFVLRDARSSDAQAVAELHATVWREAYDGIAPAAAVDKLTAAYRLTAWREALDEETRSRTTLVADCGGELAGFISFGASNNPLYGDRAEIKHLYVGNAWRGQGIGRRLMGLAFRRLHSAGHTAVGLAVVEENTNARLFYKALGGVETITFEDPGPLWKSNNVLVEWQLPAELE